MPATTSAAGPAEAPLAPAPAPWLRPPDSAGASYEFYAPFAHVPGRFEWCRIRSPSHGVFDTFILLGGTTAEPATVHVNSELGASFLRERFPECQAIRVPPGALRIEESPDGRRVTGHLQSSQGPLAAASMAIASSPATLPRSVPYGGDGKPVWGSRWTCWGVDLVVDATANGRVQWRDGRAEDLRAAPAVLTLGSFGRLAPLTPLP